MSRRGFGFTAAMVAIVAVAAVSGVAIYALGGAVRPSQQPSTPTSVGTSSTSTQTTTPNSSVTIVTDQLNLDHQESMSVATWAVAVKNSGNQPVRSLALSLSAPFAASMCTDTSGMLVGGFGTGTCAAAAMASPLEPGQTLSGGLTLSIMDTTGMPMQGAMYTMILTASYADGSTTTDSFSISAQMM